MFIYIIVFQQRTVFGLITVANSQIIWRAAWNGCEGHMRPSYRRLLTHALHYRAIYLQQHFLISVLWRKFHSAHVTEVFNTNCVSMPSNVPFWHSTKLVFSSGRRPVWVHPSLYLPNLNCARVYGPLATLHDDWTLNEQSACSKCFFVGRCPGFAMSKLCSSMPAQSGSCLLVCGLSSVWLLEHTAVSWVALHGFITYSSHYVTSTVVWFHESRWLHWNRGTV
jgi:hypothetical protein